MSHDRLERLRQLNRTRFKRHTGIYPETFAEMELVVGERERSKKKSGRPPPPSTRVDSSSSPPEFWREYRTFAHLGHDWNIHETTVQRTVERVETALIQSGEFRLPGRKSLKQEENVFQIIAVDAAETPCERPASKQRRGLLPRIWTVLNRDLDSFPASPLEREVTYEHPTRQFTEAQIIQLLQDAQKGDKSVEELCCDFGCSPASFCAWRKK